MILRTDVYSAVDSERDYQDTLIRNGIPTELTQGAILTPMEQLAVIRRIVRDMENHWYSVSGPVSMDYMRKIAAVAVRTMEQFGAPYRELVS